MSELTVPIRGDVPMDMHPDTLLPQSRTLDQEATVGVSVLAAGREALIAAYEGFGKLNDAEAALRRLEEKPYSRASKSDYRMKGGRPAILVQSEELMSAAQKAFERLTPTIDRRVKELQTLQKTLGSRVDEAIDDKSRRTPEGLSIAASIRDHVKSLGKSRVMFVTSAIERGDLKTASAILAAPAYLSGLTDSEHAAIKSAAAHKFAPVDNAQLKATDLVLDRVMQAGGRLVERYSRVLSMRDSDVAKARAKVAALAAHGES
jgi:hypothetical protein